MPRATRQQRQIVQVIGVGIGGNGAEQRIERAAARRSVQGWLRT